VIGGSDPSAVGAFDMTPKMFQTLMFSIVVFSILFVDLIWHRVRLGKFQNYLEELKIKLQV
jgi:heme exporter protein C